MKSDSCVLFLFVLSLFTAHLVGGAWGRRRDNVFLTREVKCESTSERIGVTEILSGYKGMKKI